MERNIKRGDIFFAKLNPVIGSEQGGTRPVLVISNNTGNRHSPTVIIAPITSKVHNKTNLPTHITIRNFKGLDKESIILLEQIRTIDKQRLGRYVGHLGTALDICVNYAIVVSLGIDEPIKTPVKISLCQLCANRCSILPYHIERIADGNESAVCMCCDKNTGICFEVSWK